MALGGEEVAGVAAHPALAVEGAGHDEQRPAQPLGDDAAAAHGDAGAGHHRDPARGADGPEQPGQRGRIDAGAGGHAVERERLDRGGEPRHVGRAGVLLQLGAVGAVGEELAHEEGEDLVVGAGQRRDVVVGERRGLGAPRVEHPDLAAARPEVAQPHDRVGERGAVPVRHDRVAADHEQQARAFRIPNRVQVWRAAHQLGGAERRRVVDRDRRVALARPQHREQPVGRHPPVDVVREPGAEVRADRVRPVLGDHVGEARAQVVERDVPGGDRAGDEWVVEPVGIVLERAQRPALRTRVAARHRVAGVAPHPDHAIAVDFDGDTAVRRADAAEAQHLAGGRSGHAGGFVFRNPCSNDQRWRVELGLDGLLVGRHPRDLADRGLDVAGQLAVHRGGAPRELDRGVEQLVVGDAAPREPDLDGPLALDPFAEQVDRERRLRADGPFQQPRVPAARVQADLGEAGVEAGGRAHQPDVAREREVEAGPDRGPVDRGDRGQRAVADREEAVVDVVDVAGVALPLALGAAHRRETRQVSARAERGWRTGDDDRADVVVGFDRGDSVDDLADELEAQGVTPLGVVEGEDAHALPTFDVQGHSATSLRSGDGRLVLVGIAHDGRRVVEERLDVALVAVGRESHLADVALESQAVGEGTDGAGGRVVVPEPGAPVARRVDDPAVAEQAQQLGRQVGEVGDLERARRHRRADGG